MSVRSRLEALEGRAQFRRRVPEGSLQARARMIGHLDLVAALRRGKLGPEEAAQVEAMNAVARSLVCLEAGGGGYLMTKCSGITQAGTACKGIPIEGSQWCHAHHPTVLTNAAHGSKGGKRGGRGRPVAELARLSGALRSWPIGPPPARSSERCRCAVAVQSSIPGVRAAWGRHESPRRRGACGAPDGARGGPGDKNRQWRAAMASIERRIRQARGPLSRW